MFMQRPISVEALYGAFHFSSGNSREPGGRTIGKAIIQSFRL